MAMKYIRIAVIAYFIGLVGLCIWSLHGYPTGSEPWDVQAALYRAVRHRQMVVLLFFIAGFIPLKTWKILKHK